MIFLTAVALNRRLGDAELIDALLDDYLGLFRGIAADLIGEIVEVKVTEAGLALVETLQDSLPKKGRIFSRISLCLPCRESR